MKVRTMKKRASRYMEDERKIRRRERGHHERHMVFAILQGLVRKWYADNLVVSGRFTV